MAEKYGVIGLMSGTSLDGIDLAYTRFEYHRKKWNFRLHEAETVSYPKAWRRRLSTLHEASALDYATASNDLGHLSGRLVNRFMLRHKIRPDLISSHGHTIFHQPEKKLTTQIGNGAAIAAITGIPTVCDFRTGDVAKNGQGAPLVPVGDMLLFSEYPFCLNLGGIANISFQEGRQRIASDIVPVNMGLNFLATLHGKAYDAGGRMAAKGTVDKNLLSKLNSLPFYRKPFPKSLGLEWFNGSFKPLISDKKISLPDRHATVVAHIVDQLHAVLKKAGSHHRDKMLVTGGGAFHHFLVSEMKKKLGIGLMIPGPEIIGFKEAIIFGFLGLLRWRNETNVLASVTGADKNSCSGAVYLP